VQQRFLLFKRILRRHNKPYFFEVGVFCHGVGYNQMPDMYGIEGAEKQTYFH
jgi:hypothetical protein